MAELSSNTNKVLKGISSQTVVTIGLGLLEVVFFSIMSRLLTKEDFGYYAAITAITTVFSAFSETGIGSAIVQQKEINKRYMDSAFTLSLLFGGCVSLVLFCLAGPLSKAVADNSMKIPLMLMSVTLVLQCLTSVNTSIMQRKLQFLRMGIVNIISLVITTGVAILLAYKGYGYYAIITKAVLGGVITYVLSLIMCKTRFEIAFDCHIYKKIFSFSGWLMASALFRNLSHQVDRLMMPRLLSVSALGAYNRPKDFIEMVSAKLNSIFDMALFPVLSGIQDDSAALRSAFRRSMFHMNVFALMLTTAFMFNSGLLIRVFFGEQWLSLQNVMFVISCSLLFNIDGRLADCYLRSLALTKQQFFFRVFEFALKSIGVLAGYKWGILGVALSIVITNFIAKIIKIIYIGNKVNIKPVGVISIILNSWRYAIIMFPVCLFSYAWLPKTLVGDIVMAFIFIITGLIIFVFMPNLVGKHYYDEVYVKVKSYIQQKKHRM